MPALTEADLRDMRMYFDNTFITHKPTNDTYFIRAIEPDKVHLYDRKENRSHVDIDIFLSEFDLTLQQLGYYNVDDTVVYLKQKQNNSPKKALHESNVQSFYPQAEEYSALRKDNPSYRLLKLQRTITPLSEVDNALKSSDAVVIHRNFAVVKKGFSKHPVVYHRTAPACMLIKGELVPFEPEDAIYIEKLLLELGDT